MLSTYVSLEDAQRPRCMAWPKALVELSNEISQ